MQTTGLVKTGIVNMTKKTHTTKDGRTAKKGLYYNMNKAREEGRSKPGKGTVTDEALTRSAKTAKPRVKKASGGPLKKVPEGNKGLPNLPKKVRNNMGFFAGGGAANKPKIARGCGAVMSHKRKTTKFS